MKKALYISCLILMACNSNQPKKAIADSTDKPRKSAPYYVGNLDLARLTLSEDFSAILAAEHISPEPKTDTDVTIYKYEVLRTSNPKALRFSDTDFSGTNGKKKNHILFHYDEKDKTLASYELRIYNQDQTDKLIGLIDKIATRIFKRTKTPKGSFQIDLDGNEVKPENAERKTFRVWENKKTGITYYLSETGKSNNLVTELFALKPSSTFGKSWIDLLSLDWYKIEKSEPL